MFLDFAVMSPDNICHVSHAAVADFCVAAVEGLVEFVFFGEMFVN